VTHITVCATAAPNVSRGFSNLWSRFSAACAPEEERAVRRPSPRTRFLPSRRPVARGRRGSCRCRLEFVWAFPKPAQPLLRVLSDSLLHPSPATRRCGYPPSSRQNVWRGWQGSCRPDPIKFDFLSTRLLRPSGAVGEILVDTSFGKRRWSSGFFHNPLSTTFSSSRRSLNTRPGAVSTAVMMRVGKPASSRNQSELFGRTCEQEFPADCLAVKPEKRQYLFSQCHSTCLPFPRSEFAIL